MTRTPTAALIAVLVLSGWLSACASGEFDDAREWRLRECEKILNPTDRENCIASTPDYIE